MLRKGEAPFVSGLDAGLFFDNPASNARVGITLTRSAHELGKVVTVYPMVNDRMSVTTSIGTMLRHC